MKNNENFFQNYSEEIELFYKEIFVTIFNLTIVIFNT